MAEPTILVTDDGPVLRATVRLDGCAPARALAAFTDPEVLARWWGGELIAELWPGGRYSVWFPEIPARMTGQVATYTAEGLLAFSWGWEHEPESPRRTVRIEAKRVESEASTTVLTIEHGPHGEGAAEQTARAEHRAGWEFFLPRLVSALAG